MAEVETWQHPGGFRWDHVPMDAARAGWLAQAGLDRLVVGALTAEDTRPRVTPFPGGAVVVLRGVNLNQGAEAEDMISARLWVEETRVVSVWMRPLRAVADLRKRTEAEPDTVATSGALVSRLALGLGETAAPVIAELGERVDALELQSAEAVEDPDMQADLADLRRVLIVLRRFFAPQRDAVAALRGLEADWLDKRDRQRLSEASDRVTRLTEELDALAQRALVIQDHLDARHAMQMNRQMHILSVVAALFLPLGFLTGLLGVNVGGIPGADNPRAFWLVSAGMLALAVGIALWFRALGFLGRR